MWIIVIKPGSMVDPANIENIKNIKINVAGFVIGPIFEYHKEN